MSRGKAGLQGNSYESAGRVPRMGLEIGYVRNSMYWKNLPTPHETLSLYKSQSFSDPTICRARFHIMMFVSRPYSVRPPLAANLKLSGFPEDEIKQLESLGDKLKRPYRTCIPGWLVRSHLLCKPNRLGVPEPIALISFTPVYLTIS